MDTQQLPLSVKGLNFAYGKTPILSNIVGDFYEGTFYGIAGPNGSGKTTWLKLMAGLLNPDKEKVFIDGRDIHDMPRKTIAKGLSFVPQMFSIPYAYTVREVIMMGRYAHMNGIASGGPLHDEIVDNTIVQTALFELKDRYVNELSGGELQRVMIARAIAQDSKIILLDEPISHLDIHHQHQIIELLKKQCRDYNKTVIAVLHDLNITTNHCDHIFLLKEGHIIEQGEPMQVLTEEVIKRIYDIDVKLIYEGDNKWITW